MRIIGCDLHSRQQTLAMLTVETGEIEELVLEHAGNQVREFYGGLTGSVRVGIEATGSMQWFLELMEEVGVECVVGHPAKIRAYEPRKQKHDRRDALLLMRLLAEDRFPRIWMPSVEQRDVRSLLQLNGELPAAHLQTIGFALIASDKFEWDSDDVLSEIIGDWSAPEINYPSDTRKCAEFPRMAYAGENVSAKTTS